MDASSSNLLKDDSLETVPLDIEMVKKAINKAKQIIKSSERGDNIVLFWGQTGAGKSSAIIILSGQPVKGYFRGINVITEAKPTNQEFGVRIQLNIYNPAMLKLKVKEGQQQVMLWDLPIFGDNRGPSQNLINSYFIHRIFEFHKNIKLIFTIDFHQILPYARGGSLERVLDEITRVLGNFDDYSQGVAVMITKADHRATEEEIYEYFKLILTLSSISNCQNQKKFIQCVIDKKIPLLIVKQPDVNKIQIQDAVDVTPQYQSLISQAYTTIVERLTTVSFPKLNAPAISQKEISKCKGIVEDTHSLIEKHIRAIVEPLKQFITGFYSSAIFSEDLKKVEDGLADCQRMTAFVDKIHQATQIGNIKADKEKQQLKQRFDDLQRIFESEKYLCKTNVDGTEVCEPMIALNDQYIMVRFLNTLGFDPKTISIKWKTQSQVLKRLFKDISALQLVNHWESLEQDINKRLNDFMEVGSKNIKHFEELKQGCDKCKVKQAPKIEFLVGLLSLNQKYLSKAVSEASLKNLKDQIEKDGNQLMSNATSNNQSMQKVASALKQYSTNSLHELLETREAMITAQNSEILRLNSELGRLKQSAAQGEAHSAINGDNSRLLAENGEFKQQNDNLKNLLKVAQQKKHKECCCIY